MSIYIDSGLTFKGVNKLDIVRGDLLKLRNNGITYDECVNILSVKYRISAKSTGIRGYCKSRFRIKGKPVKRTLVQLHKDIKRLYMDGSDADQIALALTHQEGMDYRKQANAIAKYIKNKGFNRPSDEPIIKLCDTVQSKSLMVTAWTTEGLRSMAA